MNDRMPPPPQNGPTRGDIDACAREPIQFLGRVQAFGALVVISHDWRVRHASENTEAILGLPASGLIGTPLLDVLSREAVHAMRGKVQSIGGDEESARLTGIDLRDDGRRFDVTMHLSGNLYLLDIEPVPEVATPRDAMAMVQPLLGKVRRARSVEEVCDIAVRGIWAMTGFARVMCYRFHADYSGEVIAECRMRNMDSFLGLHFPASDIPPQARALYERNLLRIIPDVAAPTARILPAPRGAEPPLDLSMAVTRAVSPIHIEYLQNMGVGASMSVSILREGRLWGMIACHHDAARNVDSATRAAIELFAQMLSYELALQHERRMREKAAAARELHKRLLMLFEAGSPLSEGLAAVSSTLHEVIDFHGLAVISGRDYAAEGDVPTEAEFAALEEALARQPEGKVFATDHLEGAAPGAVDPARGLGGLLAIPIQRDPRRHLMLFRREVLRDVRWAGAPTKVVDAEGRISPRRSFAAWSEEVRGHCEAWDAGEIEAAEVLRIALLELMLKLVSERSRRGEDRSARQEVLISELSHRLRNVFGLATGIIRATGQDSPGVKDFAEGLTSRFAALARANEQVFSEASGTFRLSELLRAELEAFAGSAEGLRMEGGDIALPGPLRPTLALVFHELATNAVKYGALSQPGGAVRVAVSRNPGGGAAWTWEETGGPPVTPPARRGFGSTLIANTLPHELGGETTLDYTAEGLRARFALPARHVAGFHDAPPQFAQAAPDGPAQQAAALRGRGLVVEDNLIIALHAVDALRALGAEDVEIAGSSGEALGFIDRQKPDFAVLDLDLGGASSAPVAERLRALGVPIVLATGYDAGAPAQGIFAGLPLVSKPYTTRSIGAAFASRPH